ncbi:MAG: MCE family protein [Streptosporangiales bacterium]|nr:MCE family protein [Streptosporangiales bacterium]
MRARSPSALRLATAGVVVAIAASLLMVVFGRGETVHVAAQFPRAVSLFEGSQVRILGVPVGRVTAVVPAGTSVRVEMAYDARHKVPADAKAVIVSPSLVGDRFVQLTPAYRGGPTMADGAEIPVERTASPVEFDRVTANLNDLAVALGPEGANAEGSLSDLLAVGAENLAGQGERINRTIDDVSDAADTLDAGREDLFGTVAHLQAFTAELAENDEQVRRFNRDLASVANQLAGERDELRAALRNLAVALGEVEAFVRENRELLTRDVKALTEITGVLARQREALASIIETGPLGMNNLALAYNPASGSIGSRFTHSLLASFEDLDGLLCEIARSANVADAEGACRLLEDLLEPLPTPGVSPSPIDDLASGVAGRPATPGAGGDPTLGGLLGGAS